RDNGIVLLRRCVSLGHVSRRHPYALCRVAHLQPPRTRGCSHQRVDGVWHPGRLRLWLRPVRGPGCDRLRWWTPATCPAAPAARGDAPSTRSQFDCAITFGEDFARLAHELVGLAAVELERGMEKLQDGALLSG